jgi:predicted oxidoreductase
LESVRICFQKGYSANPSQQILATLVSKYHVGADTILLSWVLKHPAKVIPIAGTVNATRIQSLIKAVELDLEKRRLVCHLGRKHG